MSIKGLPLETLALALARGETTSRALIEAALAAIKDDDAAFTRVDPEGARAAADRHDHDRSAGRPASPFAGIPLSIKDLFDAEGEVTCAGSLLLRNEPPAARDAPAIRRLRDAGFVLIGRTHMSEFAFTGLGLNPHFPPLGNPYDRGCAPGGSSGGAAVSVALGQCAGAIGTDTGGSVRIPAAFCGLTGFKPTQSRIPRSGVTPLSPSLDSIGPIANTVRCCAVLDAVMAGGSSSPGPAAARSLRLATPQQEVLEGLDPEVAAAFERALASLSSGGHQIAELNFPELSAIFTLNARGGLSNAEAFAWHRRRGFLEHPTLYDPNVLTRIKLGEGLSAGDYLDLLEGRRSLIAAADARTAPFDALIWPTTPILAPRLDRLASPDAFSRLNGLALRNTSIANFLDRCAISVPMQAEGAPPCGLMIMGERLQDERLLSQAQTIAAVIKAAPAA